VLARRKQRQSQNIVTWATGKRPGATDHEAEGQHGAFGEEEMSKDAAAIPNRNLPIKHAEKPAKTACGLRVVESCLSCAVAEKRVFCKLPATTLERLDGISSAASYPPGAVLFAEGQEPRGVFLICNGRVKLSSGSAKGKPLIFRIAEAGEIIGLPGALSGKPYEVTAEASEATQANFIARRDFVAFLRQNGEAAVRVAEMLVGIYHSSCQELRYVGLSKTAAQKLARFLLDLPEGRSLENAPQRVTLHLTHEEIGEVIGASRETVTRLFTSFKRKQLIAVESPYIIINNRLSLEDILDM
jgi:CRP/FNR family transcriptional regulator, cyclic AMP receptor protein